MSKKRAIIGPMFLGSILCVILASLLCPANSFAKTARQIDDEVDAVLEALPRQVPGAKEFLEVAKGVLVIPNIVKAGLVVGGEYGEGALRIEGKTVDYYSLASGSIGLQIGAQKKNLVLIFIREEALQRFRTSAGWKAGVDASVAMIDKGATASTDTTKMKDPIVGFIFGERGGMAGATIEGAKFTKIVR